MSTHADFWDEKVKWAMNHDTLSDGARAIRVNGNHYVFNRWSNKPPIMRGFYGRAMTAMLLDGSAVTSNDVWYQGAIPEEYRDRLPDNCAKIIEGSGL